MFYDVLWCFMMFCDGLWWFMMVYDGLWYFIFPIFCLELNSCLWFRGYVKGIQRSVWTENVVGRNTLQDGLLRMCLLQKKITWAFSSRYLIAHRPSQYPWPCFSYNLVLRPILDSYFSPWLKGCMPVNRYSIWLDLAADVLQLSIVWNDHNQLGVLASCLFLLILLQWEPCWFAWKQGARFHPLVNDLQQHVLSRLQILCWRYPTEFLMHPYLLLFIISYCCLCINLCKCPINIPFIWVLYIYI